MNAIGTVRSIGGVIQSGAPAVTSDDLDLELTATGADVQTFVLATLPSAGDAAFIEYHLRGEQTNGQRGWRYTAWIDASRNAAGIGAIRTGNIGPTGHTSTGGGVPFSETVGQPTGWGLVEEVAIVGNNVVVTFNSAAAQTVRWGLTAKRKLLGGAT